jgi:hypothetical protein
MRRETGDRDNLLHFTIAMRPDKKVSALSADWHARCTRIYCDLRGYLMGNTGQLAEATA